MILKNKKGIEKEFTLILKFIHEDKTFLVYKDEYSKKLYGGIKEENTLKSLDDEDTLLINKLLKRIDRE